MRSTSTQPSTSNQELPELPKDEACIKIKTDREIGATSETQEMNVIREIAKGGIILEEKPFVYILCSKFRTERCDFCFQNSFWTVWSFRERRYSQSQLVAELQIKTDLYWHLLRVLTHDLQFVLDLNLEDHLKVKRGQLSKCSGCRNTYYCGKFCQREGWSIHKLECNYLKQIAPRMLPDAARMLARLIKILEKGGHNTKSYYTDKKYRTFKDLMSHYPNIKNDQTRMEHFSSLYGVLHEFFRGEFLPNSAELLGMYGRMCVNSFSICNQEMQSLGTGMYLGASIVDHSCEPTAVVTFEGTTLIMRALKTLPSLDWSKIFISYIDVMTTKRERQTELEQTYYFLCHCSKCIKLEPTIEMTGAACPNSNCDNCLNSTSMQPGDKCSKCDSLVTEEFITNFQDVLYMTNLHLESMKDTTYLDVCQVCLEKQKGVFYKFNVKHIKILDLAFDSSIEFGKLEDAIEYGLQLVKGFHDYYGYLHPMTGLLHLKLAKLLLYQNQPKDALEHFQHAKSILMITHGLTSSLFKEHVKPLFEDIMLENGLS